MGALSPFAEGAATRALGGVIDDAGARLVTQSFGAPIGVTEADAMNFARLMDRQVRTFGGSVAGLGDSLLEIGPAARDLGMSGLSGVQQVTPLLGALLRGGFGSDTVGTGVRSVLEAMPQWSTRLSSPAVSGLLPSLTAGGVNLDRFQMLGTNGFLGIPNMAVQLGGLRGVATGVTSQFLGDMMGPAAGPVARFLVDQGSAALSSAADALFASNPGAITFPEKTDPWDAAGSKIVKADEVESAAPWAVLGRGDQEARFRLMTGWKTLEGVEAETIARHELASGKPLLQHVGSDLDELKVQIILDRAWCDVAKELDALRGLLKSQQAHPLVFGNGVYRGRFVLLKMSTKIEVANQLGAVERLEATLELQESIDPPRAAVTRRPVARTGSSGKPRSDALVKETVTNRDGYSIAMSRRPGDPPANPPTPARRIDGAF
jgi:phage protein U